MADAYAEWLNACWLVRLGGNVRGRVDAALTECLNEGRLLSAVWL